MNFFEFNEYVRKLESGCWRPTMFEDLQVQYCEERLYALRCKHGTPNEHICLIREQSEDSAIARAVFDLHKADKNTSVTVRTDNGNALVELANDLEVLKMILKREHHPKGLKVAEKAQRIIEELAKIEEVEKFLFEKYDAETARRTVHQIKGNTILKCRAIAKESEVSE